MSGLVQGLKKIRATYLTGEEFFDVNKLKNYMNDFCVDKNNPIASKDDINKFTTIIQEVNIFERLENAVIVNATVSDVHNKLKSKFNAKDSKWAIKISAEILGVDIKKCDVFKTKPKQTAQPKAVPKPAVKPINVQLVEDGEDDVFASNKMPNDVDAYSSSNYTMRSALYLFVIGLLFVAIPTLIYFVGYKMFDWVLFSQIALPVCFVVAVVYGICLINESEEGAGITYLVLSLISLVFFIIIMPWSIQQWFIGIGVHLVVALIGFLIILANDNFYALTILSGLVGVASSVGLVLSKMFVTSFAELVQFEIIFLMIIIPYIIVNTITAVIAFIDYEAGYGKWNLLTVLIMVATVVLFFFF